VVVVEDAADNRLADYCALTDVALRTRIEQPLGVFIAEGSLVIERALAAGYRMRSALMSPRWFDALQPVLQGVDAPIYLAPEDVLREVTGFHVHRGALAGMHRKPQPEASAVLRSARRIVVVEDIVSHTNLGAIFRSAGALGMDGVLLTPSCADPLYRRSVRVSMGGVFALPWARLGAWQESLQLLRDEGFTVLALTPAADATDVRTLELAERVALVLGTEGGGLSTAALGGADRRVRIPMARGMDSLNVAAAAAIAFYELSR
jgi:tRNA G18 (ribose-2'-O)-methylase SpoU